MIEILRKLRGGRKTAADLRTALAQIDVPSLSEVLDAAIGKRDELLLDGSDKQVLEAEAEINAARIAFDRGKAVWAELERRIGIAEKEEAETALTAERDRIEREAAAVAAELERRWPGAQAVLVELLDKLHRAEDAVQKVNERLAAAGRDEWVADVEWRSRPKPQVEWERAVSLSNTTLLPHLSEWGLQGYGQQPMAPVFLHSLPSPDHRAEQSTPKPLVAQPAGGIIFPRT